jgi:hypothetical protein
LSGYIYYLPGPLVTERKKKRKKERKKERKDE